jgi:L-alanine-DL-glutamate epimerase-like enolase superfamily enzyme
VKLGKNGKEDILRVQKIREAVGDHIKLRLDANQGWDFETAKHTLQAVEHFNIQFCEQPMHKNFDPLLPKLKQAVGIPIMADESVFNHYDAERLIANNSCQYINIKLAKSGGILEAKRIADVAQLHQIPCMLGGMVESRLALTAKLHFARSHNNICFYDLDTCMLGHLEDPVLGGVQFSTYFLDTDDVPGIGADIDPQFLHNAEHITIN